jgi:C1A family cysteine protease
MSLCWLTSLGGQAPVVQPPVVAPPVVQPIAKVVEAVMPVKSSGKGYIPLTHERRRHFRAISHAKHGGRLEMMAKNQSLPPSFDCRVKVPLPVWDQANCGSCYEVSTVRTATCTLIKGGYGKADNSFMLAAQYGMDSPRSFGGCGGGNGTEVIDWMCKNGWIAETYIDAAGTVHKDYPPYQASSGRDRTVPGAKVWMKGAEWGYVNANGPTIDEIKTAIVNYGRLNVSLDASGSFMNGTGTITSLGTSIDHEINCAGYDDNNDNGDGTKGALLLENQWNTSWGNAGYRWVSYRAAANLVDVFFVTASPLPPVNPSPSITGPTSATAVAGSPFSVQIVALGAATSYGASPLPTGLAVDANSGIISGTPTQIGTSTITLSATNASGTGNSTMTLTVTQTPPPPPNPPSPPVIGPSITFSPEWGAMAGIYYNLPPGAVVGSKGSVMLKPSTVDAFKADLAAVSQPFTVPTPEERPAMKQEAQPIPKKLPPAAKPVPIKSLVIVYDDERPEWADPLLDAYKLDAAFRGVAVPLLERNIAGNVGDWPVPCLVGLDADGNWVGSRYRVRDLDAAMKIVGQILK